MIAIIFGVTGQDGFYLSKILLDKGYKVIGVVRPASINNKIKLINFFKDRNFCITEGDVTDPVRLQAIIGEFRPDEVYNLAAQSHVGTSFEQPTLTWNVTACGCFNILEAIRFVKPDTKFYQASSSEMFGDSFTQGLMPDMSTYRFQNEKTPMAPKSPYAVAKLAAHHTVRLYRDSYGLFACSGILMNHESPMRGEKFVTRKITKWIGEYLVWESKFGDLFIQTSDEDNIIIDGEKFPKLRLGNLNVYRDWGHAEDHCEAMHLMMQHTTPDDYVISTMQTNSLKDFLSKAFSFAKLGDWGFYVKIDQQFFRPADISYILGDSTKARKVLGWRPKKSFNDLIQEMVVSDYEKAKTSR